MATAKNAPARRRRKHHNLWAGANGAMEQANRLAPLVESQPSLLDLSVKQYERLQARQADVNQATIMASEPTG